MSKPGGPTPLFTVGCVWPVATLALLAGLWLACRVVAFARLVAQGDVDAVMAYNLMLMLYVLPSVSMVFVVNVLASLKHFGLPKWMRISALAIALLNIGALAYLLAS